MYYTDDDMGQDIEKKKSVSLATTVFHYGGNDMFRKKSKR